MPIYLLLSHHPDFLSLMSYSSPIHIWNYATAFAEGRLLDNMTTYYVPYAFITALPIIVTKNINIVNIDIASVQFIQGAIDSLGCFIIYKILKDRFSNKHGFIGATLYAIWPSSIFYSYHILAEAYTPILILTVCYLFINALEEKNYKKFTLLGIACAIFVLLRPDNIFVMPAILIYSFWYYKKHVKSNITYILAFIVAFYFIFFISNRIITTAYYHNLSKASHSVAIGLFNSLGEYPGIYKGLRFYDDGVAIKHIVEQEQKYKETNDTVFLYLHKTLNDISPGLPVYIREVIVGQPILYIDTMIRRLFVYSPGHPYCATIAYFLSKFPNLNGWTSMTGYRYSQIYHGIKYFDYFLFTLFLCGLWTNRKNRLIMSLFVIYMAILVGHVLSSVGEVFFRIGPDGTDAETAFIYPAYLLGMVSIWPVVIPLGLGTFRNLIRRTFFTQKISSESLFPRFV